MGGTAFRLDTRTCGVGECVGSFDVGLAASAQDGCPRRMLERDGCCPVGAHWLHRVFHRDVDGSAPDEAVAGLEYRTRAADGDGDDGDARLGGDHECAHVERAQPWGAGKPTFGEDHQPPTSAGQRDQPVGVADTTLAFDTLDELGSYAAEHEPAERPAAEDLTGHEPE